MGIVQVEGPSTLHLAGAGTLNLGTPTTLGELIVVAASSQNITSDSPAISDSASQSYTQILKGGQSFGFGYGLWYVQNSAAGVTSVTNTCSANSGMMVAHYTGIAISGAPDKNSGTPATGGTTPWNSPAETTTIANELLIGLCYALYGGSGNATLAASGSWTQDYQFPSATPFDGGNGTTFAFAHQIVSSIQTNVENTGTNSAATPGNAYPSIATFKGGTLVVYPALMMMGVGS